MRALFYSTMPFEPAAYQAANSLGYTLDFTADRLTAATAPRALGYDTVVTFINDEATAPVLAVLASLGIKHVATRSAGYDHINVAAANRLGINVARVPAYSPYSIAEHAVMLMLALNRQLLAAQRGFDRRDYRVDNLMGFDMHGKTVGLVGAGMIGQKVAAIMRGFGCTVLAFDPYPSPELATLGVQVATLEEVLTQSDIISLHCPLTAENTYLLNEQTLATCKRGVMIINTARGKLIDTQAMISALQSGQVGYLGIDVYEKEKGLFFFDHSTDAPDPLLEELRALPNVIVTAHQAFLTQQALHNIVETTLHNLTCWQQGTHNANAVGDELLSPPRL